MSTLKIKRSFTPGVVPTTANLVEGQLAANIPDKKLYIADNANNIITLVAPYTAGIGLTLTGQQFTITNTTVAPGTYTKLTVNAQGQATVGAQLANTDITTALGFTPYNATNPNGFITANQNITYTGDATGTGTTAVTLALANTTVVPGTYTKLTVDSKGRATLGAQLASLDVTTALTFTPLNKAGDTLSGALNYSPIATMASAATVNIGASTSNDISISGSVTITAFDIIASGAVRKLEFTGAPILTNNASIVLPTGANIQVNPGDTAEFVSRGGGTWRCNWYQRANGTPLVAATDNTKLPLTGGTLTGPLTMTGQQLSGPFLVNQAYTFLDKGTVISGTATFDYSAATVQRLQVGGNLTIALSNFPSTSNLGELLIELVNGAAATITWPAINWIKSDGTTTTTFSANGVTLQTAGTDFVVLWTRDNGVTVFGKIVR